MNFTILRYNEIESTNDEALSQARRGANEGLCIVANRQTKGRGRHGRIWVSPENAGLYFSLILRPTIEKKFLPLITLMSAVAVHDTLETLYKFECDIKWVNDIHVFGKKICGILAETCETETGLAIIVGIGINLQSTNFPEDLQASATSIEAETKILPNVEIVLQNLTQNLSKFYDILNGKNGAETIRREWTNRSSYAFGKNVKVTTEHEEIFGTTRGIEENGALRVELETGEIRIVNAGDVTQVRRIKN